MKATWFGTSILVILGVQSVLWVYARRHGSEGELMWPSFYWSLCAALLQSLWGYRLVRPSAQWTLARTIVRGMSIGLLVSLLTGAGGAFVVVLLTTILTLRDAGRL